MKNGFPVYGPQRHGKKNIGCLRFALFVMTLLALWSLSANVQASGGIEWKNGSGTCRALFVPVNIPDVPNAKVYGELCLPPGPPPKTVEFLVHGSTFNHFYWDWPVEPEKYSHVKAALDAGYATFNIDRLGSGWSTKPLSDLVSLDVMMDSLHQLVVGLRTGSIGGHPFERVVYFGSSLSTVYGWLLAERYPRDADAFVLTGLVHFTRPTWLDRVFKWHVDPACTDPKWKFSGVDCGYVTTTPGKRTQFFWYEPNASHANIVVDELLKDIVSKRLIFESAAFVLGEVDPTTSPSQAITVPTLIGFGEFDNTACGDDGLTCNEENVLAFERPFYRSDIVLDAYVPKNTGHALPLHFSAPETADFIHQWLDEHVGAN
jgi:pimeloyl-ACP methyl ester carboxylesterase